MSKLTPPQTDLTNRLQDLRPNQKIQTPARNEKVYEASKLYEAQFLREMQKAMRKSVQESELIKKNMGEKIFQEKLDHEYVDTWVNKGGVGLADVIYNHLMERFHGVSMTRPIGPISLQGKSVKLESSGQVGATLKAKGHFNKEDVVAPWEGRVSLSDGSSGSLILNHDNGMRSSLLMPEATLLVREGQRVMAGQKVALLDKSDWEVLMNFSKEKDIAGEIKEGEY